MSICEICGEESNQVTECKTCEEKFCAECGDVNKKLCYYCGDDDEDDDSDEDDLKEPDYN